MLEIISALIPFLLLGLVAAGLSRLSGVALSMVVVPTLLIWGATAVDVIAFMLLFVVYNNFTMETQDIRLDYKDLVLFPKWRLCIHFEFCKRFLCSCCRHCYFYGLLRFRIIGYCV